MDELALNILDVACNSVKAGAKNVTLDITADTAADTLTVTIGDDGCGMDESFLRRVTDPFTTTRTTRKVGMGLPLYKMTAEMTGGRLTIDSTVGEGTTVTAVSGLKHIDRPPLGDVGFTVSTLISGSPDIRFRFRYAVDGNEYTFDSLELSGFDVRDAFVVKYIGDMIAENIENINGGTYI